MTASTEMRAHLVDSFLFERWDSKIKASLVTHNISTRESVQQTKLVERMQNLENRLADARPHRGEPPARAVSGDPRGRPKDTAEWSNFLPRFIPPTHLFPFRVPPLFTLNPPLTLSTIPS